MMDPPVACGTESGHPAGMVWPAVSEPPDMVRLEIASGGAANRESRPPFSEPAHTGYPATPYTGTGRGEDASDRIFPLRIARGCDHGDHPRGPAQAGGGRPVSVHPGADVDPSRPHGGAGAEASRGVRTPSTGATSGARRGRLSLPRWPSPSARCSHAPDGSGARSNGTSLLTRVEDEPPSPVTRRVRDVVLDDPAGQVSTRRSTPHCAPPTSARVFLGARSRILSGRHFEFQGGSAAGPPQASDVDRRRMVPWSRLVRAPPTRLKEATEELASLRN